MNTSDHRPRKVNECLIGEGEFWPSIMLFDDYWRSGELAMLFGPTGSGKSVLAVQVADALARGRVMEGFIMPLGRTKVLHVDLALTDAQFQERYTCRTARHHQLKNYRFADNLYRGRPRAAEDLCDWLETEVRESGFEAVIIDDISAVKRTHDGVRETLAAMRRLKALCDDTGVSILVLATSDMPGRYGVSESDLGRSRVLCPVADSVFTLGPAVGARNGEQCLKQLRTRAERLFWTGWAAPTGRVERLENGFIGFRFDERFEPGFDEETRELICRIHAMRLSGMTFKAIADALGVSKTRAFGLNRKWSVELEKSVDVTLDAPEPDKSPEERELSPEAEHIEALEPPAEEREAAEMVAAEQAPPLPTEEAKETVSEEVRVRHGPERVSVCDMKRGINAYGQEIFIQETDEFTGKPRIWFKFDRKGNKIRSVRSSLGIAVTSLGPTEFL